MSIAIKRWIREPSAINAAQTAIYIIAGATGVAAAFGALLPQFMTSTIGPVLITVVGVVQVIGGITGAAGVLRGMWWLERIALCIMGLGWLLLLVPALYYAVMRPQTSAIWLVVGLVITALLSAFIRYRRIDWAYLDPAK